MFSGSLTRSDASLGEAHSELLRERPQPSDVIVWDGDARDAALLGDPLAAFTG